MAEMAVRWASAGREARQLHDAVAEVLEVPTPRPYHSRPAACTQPVSCLITASAVLRQVVQH